MSRFYNLLFLVGASLLLFGAAVKVTGWPYSAYVCLIGATLVALAQFNLKPSCNSVVLRRLRRQQLIGSLLLVASGVLMALAHRNEWVLCMTIGALLELYTSFRIPQEEEKARRMGP